MIRKFFILLLGGILLTACASQPKLKSLSHMDQHTNSKRQLKIQQWHSSNGTRVIFMQAHELPMLDLRLTFAAGSSKDGQHHGLSFLTNALLDEGSDKVDARQIASGFEELGAIFAHSSYRDMAVISLRTLADPQQSDPAIALLARVIDTPEFSDSSLQRLQDQLLNSFERQNKNPARVASKLLFQHLYKQHPYAHQPGGDAQSITRIKPAQLASFYRQFYSAGNAQLVIVGDLDQQRAQQIAEQISSALPAGNAAAAVAQPQPVTAGYWHEQMDIQQTHIHLAQLGIQRDHPDYAALYVANQIFGGSGFGSRLMEEVREKRGLTYGIYSAFSPMQATGPFMISLQTKNESAQQALDLVLDLQQQLIEQGVSQQELQSAKKQILGSYPLANASNSAIVNQLAMLAFYDLPLDWQDSFIEQIAQLSLEQVNQAIARHLQPEQQILITTGPQQLQYRVPAK